MLLAFTGFDPEKHDHQDENRSARRRRESGGYRGAAVRHRRGRDIDVSSLTLRVRF